MQSSAKATPESPDKPATADLDPLLVAAQVLLWVVLIGVVIAAIMSCVGIAAYVAAQGSQLAVPIWHAVWKPLAGLLFGMGALWIAGDTARTLLAMIAAVSREETFASENIGRMERVAWNVIHLQLLGLAARLSGVDISGDISGFEIGLDLSPGGIAFALLLFILARVFRQGAAMRADLEGTV